MNIAKRDGTDFNQVLVRFALERFLYRLSQSRHVENFLLKGALLFYLWYDMPHRGLHRHRGKAPCHRLAGHDEQPVEGLSGPPVMLERETIDIDILATAIAATFLRRGMALPHGLPIGLIDEFAHDSSRQTLWLAFLKKNQLAVIPLQEIVTTLRTALSPPLSRANHLPPISGRDH